MVVLLIENRLQNEKQNTSICLFKQITVMYVFVGCSVLTQKEREKQKNKITILRNEDAGK